ncbi:acyl-CoA thioesterase [Paenibacillus eucommiae]|uniref:Acyl-CoA thioester hydrolase n=1 Tax=Paenibacillus eucommiae TaxID=1355755 RepID=A0ABS4J090_9BACL|nr:thioesterase family protein [Paenibacillus eucommiae]MBP1993257.1 acyl-CoA thioester hydrolase [Paenibacillus eucommiae]
MGEHRWYEHEIRVRYQETDQMGVVYHTNYLNWFELGRTELIRQLGMRYSDIESKGCLLPLVEAEVKFHKPARYDEKIAIYTRIASYTHVRLEFESQIRRISTAEINQEADPVPSAVEGTRKPGGELLVSGLTRHVWVNLSWKPVRIDRELPELFQLLASGG